MDMPIFGIFDGLIRQFITSFYYNKYSYLVMRVEINCNVSKSREIFAFKLILLSNTLCFRDKGHKKWMGRDLNSRPPVCETGIITSLDHPS